MMSNFHYTIIVDKRIHNNNFIAISVENLTKELHSKYECRERRDSI